VYVLQIMLGSVNDLQPCIEASITDAACPRPYFNDNDLLTICLILMIIGEIYYFNDKGEACCLFTTPLSILCAKTSFIF
jgi:hypothetical protein